MKAVLLFVLRVFPLLLQFLQTSTVTWVEISLRLLSVRAAASGVAGTLAHSPGVTVSGVNSLSYQVQTQGLSPWSHWLYTSPEQPTVRQGRGFILILAAFI